MDSVERKKALQEEMKEWNSLIIKEKTAIAGAQQQRDHAYIRDTQTAADIAKEIQRSVDEQRAQKARKTMRFNQEMARAQKAQKAMQTLRDELPPRVSDDDPRCGPASIQRFDGEDLQINERKRLQQDQMRRWMTQMVDEKDLKKWQEKEKDREFAERLEEVNYRAHLESEAIKELRAKRAREQAEYNLTLTYQKQDEKIRNKFLDTQVNLREIQSALDSDLLTENPQQTINALDASRFRADHMKGYLTSQRQAILDEQGKQRSEKLQRKAALLEEEKAWASLQEQDRRAATLLERARERDRRQQRVELANQQREQHQDRLRANREF